MEMILTGRLIDAPRALELRLVNCVVPHPELVGAAMALANDIACNAPLAVQASKRIAQAIVGGKLSREEADWQVNAEAIRVAWTKANFCKLFIFRNRSIARSRRRNGK